MRGPPFVSRDAALVGGVATVHFTRVVGSDARVGATQFRLGIRSFRSAETGRRIGDRMRVDAGGRTVITALTRLVEREAQP